MKLFVKSTLLYILFMSIRFNEKEEWDRDDHIFGDNTGDQAKLEKHPLIDQRTGDKNKTSETAGRSKSCFGSCCKGCGICCGIFIALIIVALIIGVIILAIEAYPLYKGFKTSQGLYLEMNSEHPDYLKVAQKLYSIG